MAESQHIPRTHAPDISETTQHPPETPGLDTTETMDKNTNAGVEQTDSNDLNSKEMQDADNQQQTSDDENLPYYSNAEQETQPDSSVTEAPEDRFIPSANRSSYPSKYCAELKPIKDMLNTHIETLFAPVIGEYSPKKFVSKNLINVNILNRYT